MRIRCSTVVAMAGCAGGAESSTFADAARDFQDGESPLDTKETDRDGGLSCDVHDQCSDDRCCVARACVPWAGATCGPFDAGCEVCAEAARAEPALQCSWSGGAVEYHVAAAPVVTPPDRGSAPRIIVPTFDRELVAIDGGTCLPVWEVRAYDVDVLAAPAVGDLDGDGSAEIVAAMGRAAKSPGWLSVLDASGAVLAESPRWEMSDEEIEAWDFAWHEFDGAVAIADLDGETGGEVVFGAETFRYHAGRIESRAGGNGFAGAGGLGPISVAADVDLDGEPEVVLGNRIYDGATGRDETPEAMKDLPGGHPAVADLDPERPGPEIAVTGHHRYWHPLDPDLKGEARVQTVSGDVIFGPYPLLNGGAPTVADFDGDGQPEFGVADVQHYTLFDLDCAAEPVPAECLDHGILWRKDIHETSSGITNAVAFDFTGDGAAEVVYADECWLRIYDGPTGEVLWAQGNNSGTAKESPVVADVDGDGDAEIVVVANSVSPGFCPDAEPETGVPSADPHLAGVFVYGDPDGCWPPARPIWNQHAYHVTNVNDDGTIPVPEPNSWETVNSYRAQVGEPRDPRAPDLTARAARAIDPIGGCPETLLLAATIANRGATAAPAGVPVAFYYEDAEDGGRALACVADTRTALDPGEEETVTCAWTRPPRRSDQGVDVEVVADDDGTGQGRVRECRERNNGALLAGQSCGAPG